MHGIEIGQVAADEPGEHGGLGSCHRSFTQRIHQHAAQEKADALERQNAEREQRQRQQQRRVMAHENLFGDGVEQPGGAAAHRGARHHRDHAQDQKAPIFAHIIGKKPAQRRAGAVGCQGGLAHPRAL